MNISQRREPQAKAQRATVMALVWGAGNRHLNVQTRQRSSQSRGAHGTRGPRSPLAQKDLVCRVHPEGEERVRPEMGWERA